MKQFESIKKETVILNPQKDMAKRSIPSEIRIDPLTKRTARICNFMQLQWEKPDFASLIAGTDAWCPFCEDKVLKVTPFINWNYMPPAGSSLIHPHLQVFSTSSAPNLMQQELAAAESYQQEHGSNFWDDLVAAEIRNGERYLGKIGRSHWMSAFAPMGVAGDVLAVVEGARCTLELNEQDLLDIATGLSRVMAEYDKIGIYSFNMNFFTGAMTDDHYRFHLLFSPRTFFNQKLGTPDIGALRNLFNETLCMAFPEEINKMLKAGFA